MNTWPSEEIEDGAARLAEQLERCGRWCVLTGAGCSTESGIPAYRDESGAWRHKPPIQLHEFLGSASVRQRYWARSSVGYERIARAQPNGAHRALARLQALGRAPLIVTQNVDGLHQKAGSSDVLELHGQLGSVQCLGCRELSSRDELQVRLLEQNPWLAGGTALDIAPDGDAELGDAQDARLQVPACRRCGGVLKPAVVFFGETVPPERVSAAYRALADAGGLLIVGSSLMVFSGYRLARRAREFGVPIVIVNTGTTRADAFAASRFADPCAPLLERAVARLAP